MVRLKSFIFFYFLFIFTLFNNNWAGPVDSRIYCKIDADIIKVLEETDWDMEALPAISKVLKYSVSKDDNAYFYGFLTVYKVSQQVNTYIIPEFVRCAVKSFLHLLQLF